MNSTLAPKGMESRTWNGVAIQRRPADGYVNATAMCKAYGKHWSHYVENARTTQYLQALSTSLGIPRDLLIQSITTGLNELRGTWVHPRIAVDLARWLHPEFAVWMDGWFLESFTPRLVADATTAPAPLPERPRQREVWEVGGPGVVVSGGALLSAQLTVVLDAYTSHMEAVFEAEDEARRGRGVVTTFSSPRGATKRFLEWFAATHGQICQGQLALSTVGLPVASVAAPPRPPAPPAPAPAPRPPRHHQAPPKPPKPPEAAQRHDGYRPGDLITGPDLAHLLGLSAHTINRWATARSIGEERDGWRLIGRGKLSAGKQCAVYPPGCASWLFQKL
jgi:hypothetical protein